VRLWRVERNLEGMFQRRAVPIQNLLSLRRTFILRELVPSRQLLSLRDPKARLHKVRLATALLSAFISLHRHSGRERGPGRI